MKNHFEQTRIFSRFVEMPIRGSYKSVSETDRSRLLVAHKTENDLLDEGKGLGFNVGTAYNIVKSGRALKLAKGRGNCKKHGQ